MTFDGKILTLQGVSPTVVALTVLTHPRRSGDSLSYSVRILEGTLPPSEGPTSIFIDDACFSCWEP